jgi:predicted transcriptional regulator
MFIKTKVISGNTYRYLVSNRRDGDRVRQKVICYLGTAKVSPQGAEKSESVAPKINLDDYLLSQSVNVATKIEYREELMGFTNNWDIPYNYWGDDDWINILLQLKKNDYMHFERILRSLTKDEQRTYGKTISKRRDMIKNHLTKLWKSGLIQFGINLIDENERKNYFAWIDYKKCWQGCPSNSEIKRDDKRRCLHNSIACPPSHKNPRYVEDMMYYRVVPKGRDQDATD